MDFKKHGTVGDEDDRNVEQESQEEEKQYGKIYPRVWTKEPHGGKYKISTGPGSRSGYDALEQRPDGSIIPVEPGYEKPATGATTNFVGNHMTQGAIDLVQNELTTLDPTLSLRQERLDAARGTLRLPPVLIARGREPLMLEFKRRENREDTDRIIDTGNDISGDGGGSRRKTAIERYTWWDTPDKVVITVHSADVPSRVDPQRAALSLSDDNHDSIEGSTFTTLTLELPPQIEEGEMERVSEKWRDGENGDGHSEYATVGTTYVLSLRLAGKVDNERCGYQHYPEGGSDWSEIRVTLVKRLDSIYPWKSLQAPQPDAKASELGNGKAAGNVGKGQQPPDLAALRRHLIEQREGRLASRLPWFCSNGQKSLPIVPDSDVSSGDHVPKPLKAEDGVDMRSIKDVMEVHKRGEACMARGEYADAILWFTRGLELEDESVKLVMARGQARHHLGFLREAISDYTTALDLLAIEGRSETVMDKGECNGVVLVFDAMLARGRCKLQLDDYSGASEDFAAALCTKPSSKVASEALRNAKRLAHQHEQTSKRDSKGANSSSLPSFPRPGLRQFENRGKSGAAF